MAYPTEYLKGRYQALFWCIFNLGAVIGGLITLATNFHSTASEPSLATYVFFVGIMILGMLP